MDLLYAEVLGVCFVFFGLILFSVVPYFLVRFCNKRRPIPDDDGGVHDDDFTSVKKRQHESRMKVLLVGVLSLPWFSLLNCFASGVFMATCFIGLVPHVRDHVIIYQRGGGGGTDDLMHATASNNRSRTAEGHSHSLKGREPWAEFLLVVGFLSVLLLEELITILQGMCCAKKRSCDVKKDFKKGTADVSDDKHGQSCPQNGTTIMTKSEKFRNQIVWRTNSDEVNEVHPLMDIVTLKDDNSSDSYGSRRSPTSSLKKSPRDEKSIDFNDHRDQTRNHCHQHHSVEAVFTTDNHSLTLRSVALLMSLSVHGVFEGVALGLQDNPEMFLRLLTGVMTHEILCAAAFGINLAGHRVKIGSAILSSLLLALTVPGGMLAGLAIRRSGASNGNSKSELMIKIILEGFAAGTFVYVAFFDMLAHEMLEKKFKLLKILFVFTGFFTFFFVTLSL